jgi:hypothetical protein
MNASRHRQTLEAGYCRELLRQVRERCRAIRNPPSPLMQPQDLARLHEHPNRYDPQRWFEIFRHLHLKDGYVLDFVYHLHGNTGAPLLYARRAGEPRRGSVGDQPAEREEWQAVLDDDRTPAGLFERVVLARVAHRFHRHWHAFADQAEFICGREELQRELEACPEPVAGQRVMPPGTLPVPRTEVLARAAADLIPSVEQDDDGGGRVYALSWQRPGGLTRQVYAVRQGCPVRLVGEEKLCEVSGGPIY